MRPIHIADLDDERPVLILTREPVRPYMARVTVAPITTTIRGLSSAATRGTLGQPTNAARLAVPTTPCSHLPGRSYGARRCSRQGTSSPMVYSKRS